MSNLRTLRQRGIAVVGSCVLLWVVLGSLPLAAQAPPSGDTFVSSGTPKLNYGPSIILVVQAGSTSYLQFNLSTVPAGANVSKATLRLYVDAVIKSGSFDVYQINSSWSENTLTFNTPPPPLGVSATGGHPISVSGSSQNQFLLIDITSLVQGWVTGTIPNNGVALALTSSSGTFSFDSKESLLTGNGPELEIALKGPPGPQGPQGMQGPMGVDGAPGAQGLQGPAGQGLSVKGNFDKAAKYAAYDVVSFNGSSYVAKQATSPNDPAPDTNPNWSLMANQGAQGLPGLPGPQGLQGLQGPQGPQGQPGTGTPTLASICSALETGPIDGNILMSLGCTALFAVGGTASGLSGTSTAMLTLSGGSTLTISANGGFTFPSLLPLGTNYTITVSSVSAGETCQIMAGSSGTAGPFSATATTIACKAVTGYPVGASPRGIASDGTNIWVANSGDGTVTKLRASDGVNMGTYQTGNAPWGVVFDGANIWVTNSGDSTVTKLRASDGANLGTFGGFYCPKGLTFDGLNIWAANTCSPDGTSYGVTEIQASDGTLLGTFGAGDKPAAVAFGTDDGNPTLWIASNGVGQPGSVTRLRTGDGSSFTAPLNHNDSYGMAIVNSVAYITDHSDNVVTRFDGGQPSTYFSETLSAPAGIVFDGTNFWIANSGNNTVTKQGPHGIEAFPTGASPDGIVFDGTHIWVTNSGDGTVSKF